MAINYDQGQVPKGASNSNNLAQTPGTQLAAVQNVNTGANINPNMPMGPQLAKQNASGFQKGLMKSPGPKPTPRPAPATRQARQRPVISQGLPMEQGRGYNIFSGLDANQISGMNQNMGLSNMTALPALAPAKSSMPAVDPAMSGFGLTLGGRPISNQLRSGQGPEDEEGFSYSYDEETGNVKKQKSTDAGVMVVNLTAEEFLDEHENTSGFEGLVEDVKGEGDGYVMPTYEELLSESYQESENEQDGFDTEKKQQAEQQLDQKYASILDQLLAGVDRQAAMMGTFGSGAHSTSINNAIATGLQQMADEYASLGLADMQQAEIDIDQKVANKLAIAGLLKELEMLDSEGAEYTEKFNMASTVAGSLIVDAQNYNDLHGSSSFTLPLNEIERLLTDELLNANPSDYAEIQNKYESYLTDYMAFVDQYKKIATDVANSDYSSEAIQNRNRMITNDFLAPLLMELGLVDTLSIYGNADYKQYWVEF